MIICFDKWKHGILEENVEVRSESASTAPKSGYLDIYIASYIK